MLRVHKCSDVARDRLLNHSFATTKEEATGFLSLAQIPQRQLTASDTMGIHCETIFMNTVHTYNEFSSQAVILCLIPIWLGICYRGVALSTLSGGDSGHLCLLFSGDDGCRSMVDAACIPLRCATGEVKTYTQTHAGAVEEFLLTQKKMRYSSQNLVISCCCAFSLGLPLVVTFVC